MAFDAPNYRALSPDELSDIKNRFRYHKPSDTTATTHEYMRNSAEEFAYEISALTPKSREQSLALTKLEEAMFWANAAIARHDKDGGRR